MDFCTSIHCMDGRIQEPIIKYLKNTYALPYVDTITEPGPCKILAEGEDNEIVASIIKRIEISINKHGSKLIAVSGHHDCAGNPCDEETHKKQIKQSVKYLKDQYSQIKITGLWVDNDWAIHPLEIP